MALGAQQPAHEGVDRPQGDRTPGPVEAGAVVLQAVHDDVDQVGEGPTSPPSGRTSAWRSCAITLSMTIGYCWRSSSASANRNGSRSAEQNSCRVQKNDVTPSARAATSGTAADEPLRGGALIFTDLNASAGSPSRA